MGNCPSNSRFTLLTHMPSCVLKCPEDKGFENIESPVEGPMCAYKNDRTKFVRLNPMSSLQEPITMEQLQTRYPDVYNAYKSEEARFDQEFPVVYSQIDKDVAINNAFKELQAAENVRDESPAAYQAARVKYYSLVKGDEWKNEERERVLKAEVQPLVQQYQSTYNSVRNQITDQQKTLDVVKSVKDKVLSVQDELDYSVSSFGKQLTALKNQINMGQRGQKSKEYGIFEWLNVIFNVLIVLFLGGAIYAIYRKMKPAYSYPSYYY